MSTLHQAVEKLRQERRDGTRPPAVYPEPQPYVPKTALELIECLELSADYSSEEEFQFDKAECRLICDALRLLIAEEQKP